MTDVFIDVWIPLILVWTFGILGCIWLLSLAFKKDDFKQKLDMELSGRR